MSFWTTKQIQDALRGQNSPVVNGQADRASCACYELCLGTEAFITSKDGKKQEFKKNAHVDIPPGQYGLLLTEERIRIPRNVLAFISIKASKKMMGLVNVSGFHVDPGFEGRLKFSVYNAGAETIGLDVGEPLFLIWFFELAHDDERPYDGPHKGQSYITPEDISHMRGEWSAPPKRVQAL